MGLEITALISAAIGGALALLGVSLTNRSSTARLRLQLDHEAAQRKAQILRERGEELYILTAQWLNGLTGYYLRMSSVMQGKLTYNQSLDLGIADGKANPVNFNRVELLINVYFPSTREAYTRTTHARETLNEIAEAHKQAYKTGDVDGTKFLEPFSAAIMSINAEGAFLQTQILESIRQIVP